MIHEFDDALRADPERFTLAQKAAKLLDEATRKTRFPVRASWQLPTEADDANAVSLGILGDGIPAFDLPSWPVIPITRGLIRADKRGSDRRIKFQVLDLWDDYLASVQEAIMQSSVNSSQEYREAVAS